MIDPNDLISSSDAATLLGIGRTAISNYKRRHIDFPPPVASVSNGTVDLYLRSEIMEWFMNKNPALVKAIQGELL